MDAINIKDVMISEVCNSCKYCGEKNEDTELSIDSSVHIFQLTFPVASANNNLDNTCYPINGFLNGKSISSNTALRFSASFPHLVKIFRKTGLFFIFAQKIKIHILLTNHSHHSILRVRVLKSTHYLKRKRCAIIWM